MQHQTTAVLMIPVRFTFDDNYAHALLLRPERSLLLAIDCKTRQSNTDQRSIRSGKSGPLVPGSFGLVEKHNCGVLHRDLRDSPGVNQQFVGTQAEVAGAFPRRKLCGGAEIGPVNSSFCETDVELLGTCLADMSCGNWKVVRVFKDCLTVGAGYR
jgi:hypothetical protein